MTDVFFQIQNIYFVPIRRQRLAFAVLVRRALQALEPWTDSDTIAIVVPKSIVPTIQEFVLDHRGVVPLPVKLIESKWPDSNYLEVFPITPCDGIVEAARYAAERGLRCEGIDLEVAPGHLMARTCVRDRVAAEDELALQQGLSVYLKLVESELAVPPARFDPLDALREVRIAEQLQTLAPLCRRVFVVCDVVNFEGIKRQVSSPLRHLTEEHAPRPNSANTRIVEPVLSVMLRYLDDFPRLTQRYEELREQGKIDTFDKKRAIFEIVQEVGSKAGHGYRSIRRLRVFQVYLQGILNASQRGAPSPDVVAEAFRGCFGYGKSQRLVHELARYGRSINVERISSAAAAPNIEEYALVDRRQSRTHVSRSCNDTPSYFKIRKRPPHAVDSTKPKESQTAEAANWRGLRRKAIALVDLAEDEKQTEPFRGALERGVDVRRTMRSYLGPTPSVWVRRYPRRRPPRDLENEPIVWIFRQHRPPDDWQNSWDLQCTCQDHKETTYCWSSRFVGNKEELFRSEDNEIDICSQDVLGRVNYFDDDLEKVANKLGESFENRVPPHSRMSIGSNGCVLDSLSEIVEQRVPWWDILLLSAIQYAHAYILCVVPDGFRPSFPVISAASTSKKKLLYAKMNQFSQSARSAMMKTYSVNCPSGAIKEPPFKRRVTRCLKDLGIW